MKALYKIFHIVLLSLSAVFAFSQNKDDQTKNCCDQKMRQSKLDSIKKYKVFGAIVETKKRSKNPNLVPYKKGDKWGYVNYNYDEIIPCLYDSVGLFWEDKHLA